jgi:hypothetical protein
MDTVKLQFVFQSASPAERLASAEYEPFVVTLNLLLPLLPLLLAS